MYVLLQRYPDGYYSLQKAASNKHFDMIDNKGFVEIESGYYEDMLDLKRIFERLDFNSNSDNILYKDIKANTLHHTLKSLLPLILKYDNNFLENKIEVYEP